MSWYHHTPGQPSLGEVRVQMRKAEGIIERGEKAKALAVEAGEDSAGLGNLPIGEASL